MFREHLTHFSNVKSFTFFTLELVHQVIRFAVSKGGDGISKAGVGAGERFGGDVDGTGMMMMIFDILLFRSQVV